MNNPKFEKKVKQKVVSTNAHQTVSSGYGILLSYTASNNTATVQMSQKNSVSMGAIYRNVPCPTAIGVQAVAPTLGRPCWVDFQGTNTDYYPVITHFFNHIYNQIDYTNQSAAVNNTPRFMQGT